MWLTSYVKSALSFMASSSLTSSSSTLTVGVVHTILSAAEIATGVMGDTSDSVVVGRSYGSQ